MSPQPVELDLRDAATFTADHEAVYDVIVVGSGAGGAVVAKELAEGGVKVAILEEGAAHAVHRDLAFNALGRMYRDAGMVSTLGKPFIPVPLGKCFGGTTVVNSGTCFRTPEPVLEKWREKFGLHDLDSDTLDRAFSRVEAELGIAPAEFNVMGRPNTLVRELLEKRGQHGAPLRRNAPDCEGCGMCCYGCTSNAKRSMYLSYLPKAIKAGAAAYIHTRAKRILLNAQGAAAGVLAEAVDDQSRPTGAWLTLRAPRVILACGTLMTPPLLKSSGVARRNPHAGRHLTLHPASKVAAEFPERIDSWAGIPQAYHVDLLHNDGITFEGISMPPDLGCSAVPFVGDRLAHYIKRYAHIASFGFMVSDTAEGRLAWLPGLGYHYRYSLSGTDARRMQRAMGFLARLFFEGGAERVYVMVNTPENSFASVEELERFERYPVRPGDIEGMAFHPLGTCRMAATAQQGVCDANHQVFGAPGVYICDGSVVPTPLGVNPQQTIMGLATRLAGILLGMPLPDSAS